MKAQQDDIEIGQSEMQDFRQCPLKHKFRWRDGWYLPTSDHSDPNDKSATGTQWHSVVAKHYELIREGLRDPERLAVEVGIHIAALADLLDLDDERIALLIWMYEGYLQRWGADSDWEIEAIEASVRSRIYDPRTGRPTRFVLRWTADLVVRVISLDRRIAIIDNKTVESNGAWKMGDVDLDDQLGLYQRGWSNDHPEDPAIFGMLNQVRRDRLKTRHMTMNERFFRPRSTRSARELNEIELDFLSDAERMHSEGNLARPSSAPNPKQCGWKCDFKEAHIALRRSGGDWSEAERIIHARGMSQDRSNDPALARHI